MTNETRGHCSTCGAGRGEYTCADAGRDAEWVEGARPEIVCICGSSRFIEDMAVAARVFEKSGKIALSLHLLPSWYGADPDHQAEAEGVADRLDELHLRKIDLADGVFVVNPGGYIGDSMRREIAYAKATGNPVEYVVDPEQVQ